MTIQDVRLRACMFFYLFVLLFTVFQRQRLDLNDYVHSLNGWLIDLNGHARGLNG